MARLRADETPPLGLRMTWTSNGGRRIATHRSTDSAEPSLDPSSTTTSRSGGCVWSATLSSVGQTEVARL
jgi:hypothetical protein